MSATARRVLRNTQVLNHDDEVQCCSKRLSAQFHHLLFQKSDAPVVPVARSSPRRKQRVNIEDDELSASFELKRHPLERQRSEVPLLFFFITKFVV